MKISAARQLADSNVPLDFNLTVDAEPSLKLGGGASVKGAVSAGIWGKGSIPTLIEFADYHFKLSLKGEFGVEAEFFILKGNMTLLSGEINAIDKYWGTSSVSAYALNRLQSIADGDIDDSDISLDSRDYASDTSEWLGGELDYAAASSDGSYQNVSFSNLQESVYSNSQTQLIQLGDKLMMVYVEDDTSRDTYNRYRLMYSIYESSEWSQPKAVADNSCIDSAPSLATDGTNVYAAWQNISEQITDVS
ncbi:MAG: hypothetical protein LUG95_01150 [Clostridiales bacterium]|nr:hypothetical protein [Clostridiales bacterium]